MAKPSEFNDLVHEIGLLLKKTEELEIPKSEILRQLNALSDQSANLRVKLKVIEREAGTLQAKAREKMLELTKFHASDKVPPDRAESLAFVRFEKENSQSSSPYGKPRQNR